MITPPKIQETVKTLIEAGRSLSDIAEVTEIPVKEIAAMKRRNKWKPKPAAMLAEQEQEQESEEASVEAAEVLAKTEQSLLSGGREHSEMVYKKVNSALRALKKLPPLKTWKDIEMADRIARRAVGLDKEGAKNTIINLGIVSGGFAPKPAKKIVDIPNTDE
jgi:hypothetical protein